MDNLVQAHVLAAQGLGKQKKHLAAGQAYFISGGVGVLSAAFCLPNTRCAVLVWSRSLILAASHKACLPSHVGDTISAPGSAFHVQHVHPGLSALVNAILTLSPTGALLPQQARLICCLRLR